MSLYREAVLEPDNRKFAVKAAEAKAAIVKRLKESENAKEPLETSERRVLGEALHNLRQLIAKQLGSLH